MQSFPLLRVAILFVFLCTCFQIQGQGSCATPTHPDYEAMSRMYGSMGGVNWSNKTNWLDCNVCSWYGVRCKGGRVEEINLDENGLDGYFFITDGELPELRRISFSSNAIDIGFGAGANALPNLNYLDLSNNQIQEFTDGLVGLGNLRHLDLSDNLISTDMSQLISGVNQLQYLNLSNNFFYGNFPAYFGSLNSLNYLNLSDNLLSGCIPNTYSNHCNIQQNVFLGTNCTAYIPEFADWCAGEDCSDDVPLVGPASSCFGESISISAPSGFATYTWDTICDVQTNKNDIFKSQRFNRFASEYDISGLCPGTYSVTVTTTKGCEFTGSISVATDTEPDQPLDEDICEDGTIAIGDTTLTSAGIHFLPRKTAEGCSFDLIVTLTEIPRPRRTISLAICDGGSESINGVPYTSAGSFIQNVTNPGGCDSLLQINVDILPNFSSTVNLSVCPGGVAEHDGFNYPAGNSQRDYSAINGCDSIVFIAVSEYDTYNTPVNLEACSGTQALHDGEFYDIGSASRLYASINNCDSTINITVTELFPSNSTETYTICNGQTQSVNGTVYTEGTYQQNFSNSDGCESILNIIINETPPYEVTEELLMCNGVPIVYDNSNTFTSGGTYSIPKVDNLGCNYITNVLVTEADTSLTVLYIPRCDNENPVYYNGNPYYNSVGSEHHTNAAGCDSLVRLWFYHASSTEETITMPSVCYPDNVVVNDITYSSSGTFVQQFKNAAGCDSTLFVKVQINTDRTENINVEICPGGSVTVNDRTYFETGTQLQLLQTVRGCDSLLRIRISETDLIVEEELVVLCGADAHDYDNTSYSESGSYDFPFTTSQGCDSIYRLMIEKFENTAQIITDRLCLGDEIEYNDVTISSGGTYVQNLQNANGCDSTLTIIMSEYAPSNSFVQRETCEGIPWLENGQNFYTQGLHTQVINNSVDCDSTITIDLVVHEHTSEILPIRLCTGQADTINGLIYSYDQTDVQNLENANGCDSTLTVVVTVVDAIREDYVIDLCEGTEEILNGENFDSETITEQYFTAVSGCDSILTVYVNVFPHTFGQIDTTICVGSSLVINNVTYTSGGDDIQEINNVRGCDSTILVYIEELLPSSSDSTFYMCEGDTRTINGVPYEFGGNFTQSYLNAVGCDSTYFINLIEFPDTESQELRFICPGESVEINDVEYIVPGLFSQPFLNARGCDSTLNIEIRFSPPKDTILYDFVCEDGSYEFKNEIYTNPGEYRFDTLTSRGCDSTIVLSLGLLTGNDTTLYRTICEGSYFQFGNKKMYNQGSYYDEIIIGGCNTPTTLNLTVLQPAEGYRLTRLCEGKDIWINGKWVSEPGLYFETIDSKAGCDSLLTTEIVIEENIITRIDTTICQGETVFLGNWIYDEPGRYTIKRKTNYGCDSIVKLSIELYDTIPDLFEFEVCSGDSILFNNSLYSQGFYEGQYFDGVCNQRYELSVLETETLAKNETIIYCGENVEFLGESYAGTGQYLINQELGDCELIEFLNVIKTSENESARLFLCEGSTMMLEDKLVSEEGIYNFNSCGLEKEMEVFFINGDSIFMTDTIFPGESISIQGNDYSEVGRYEISLGEVAGCATHLILDLKMLSCGGERTITEQRCVGEYFNFFGEEIILSGNYSYLKNLGSIGCDSTIKLDLTFTDVPVFEIVGPTVFCDGEIIALSGPDGFDYLWSNGESTAEIEVEKSGTYNLQISDTNGCSRGATIVVEEIKFTNSLDIVIESPTSCDIDDGVIQINGEDAEGFLYSINGGDTWQPNSVFESLAAGLYEIMVSDATGTCRRDGSIPLKLKNAGIPEISEILAEDANSCLEIGGEIMIVVNDNSPMEYSIDSGATWHVENRFENIEPGVYSIQVSPIGSSCINDFSESIHIEDVGDLEAELQVVQGVSCDDATDAILQVNILEGQEPYRYNWSVNNQSGAKLSNLGSGDYSVLVQDGNACEIELFGTVEDLNLDELLVSFQDSILCEGDTIVFDNLDSNFNYLLFRNDLFFDEGQELTIKTSGNYQIIAENGSGCFIETSFLISDPDVKSLGLDFLMSSEGLVDEDIIVVNISDPMPENISWLYDTTNIEFNIIDSLSHHMVFQDTGLYEISYVALIDGCFTSLNKEIRVFQDSSKLDTGGGATIMQSSVLVDWSVTPNPNGGEYLVTINLSREGNANLSLYNSFGSLINNRILINDDQFKEHFYLPNLNPGVYSVILNIKNQVFQKSILIIR